MSTMTVNPSAILARPARQASGPRLTRRGRLVVFCTTLLLLAVALVAWGPSVTATDHAGDPVPANTVVVEPGQTMWDIAAVANPGGDIRTTIDDIAELNSLASAGDLQVGQRLAIPQF